MLLKNLRAFMFCTASNIFGPTIHTARTFHPATIISNLSTRDSVFALSFPKMVFLLGLLICRFPNEDSADPVPFSQILTVQGS